MTVCSMVVVETKVAVTVDAVADEAEPVEEAGSVDDVRAPVEVKPSVDADDWAAAA